MSGGTGGPGEFAARLRSLRERAVLTQEELADRAGLTAKAVGALERGERRRPQPHTLRALGDALGLGDADRASLAAAARPAGGDLPPPAAGPPPVRSLPTPLLGRDRERAEVAELVTSGATRLLTLTGPGGVGKTSLALDVAAAVAGGFPDGVTVVELAPVREARLVLPTVARALGARQPDLEALAAFLGRRRRLVVLDNLEHLLDAAPEVAELLARCPGLVVLATSRAALRVRAERELPLDPLPVPTGPEPGAVAASPAAQVFLDRARATGRAVPLTDGTAAEVAAICRRLDGLPLALELAAAHARFLSPAELLARLDEAMGRPRSRDLPERQRSLRATLDWSHDLLTLAEQVLLRRLAVFAGGFTLEAAERVGGDDVLPALAGLVEQSLVVPAGDRYRMLEPVRQYAAARLEEAGEAAAVADRAADFFADLAVAARSGLRGPDQAAWLERLEREHANLSASLGRLVACGRPGTAAQLGADTWMYWTVRGHTAEGLSWMELVEQADGPGLTRAEQAALDLTLAGLRYATGDVAGALSVADAAADGARSIGAGDLLAEAQVLSGTAAVFLGDLAEAAGRVDEAVRTSHAIANPMAQAHAVTALAQLQLGRGDLAASGATLAEAERIARQAGGPFALAVVLNTQASLAQLTGDGEAALRRLVEAAALAAEVGTSWTMVYTLPGLAVLAAQRGQWELAAELFAAGSATAEAASVAVAFPPDLDNARRWLPAVRAELDEETFGRAWDRGRGLRLPDVPRLAARITRRPAPS
ncbi:ATP-binding protein [Modestobacter sp. URMC 112]